MKKSPKNNLIYLRGHHLLCLQGYQGYGYDEKFKKNMDNIFHQLNIDNIYNANNRDKDNKDNIDNNNTNINNYNNVIILTDYPDDLCVCCPKLKNNQCSGELENLKQTKENIEKIKANNEKIVKMDQKVLNETKLKKNTEYTIEECILAVNKAFSSLKKVKIVCKDCRWENKCLWFQSREL